MPTWGGSAAAGVAPTELALFPLRSVLSPGGLLRLKVFEERYRPRIRQYEGLAERAARLAAEMRGAIASHDFLRKAGPPLLPFKSDEEPGQAACGRHGGLLMLGVTALLIYLSSSNGPPGMVFVREDPVLHRCPPAWSP